MKSNILGTLLAATVALGGLAACDNMDALYTQYMQEQTYSGKISNLQGQSGTGRVVLTWTNPEDQISKKIKIVYGDDKQEKPVRNVGRRGFDRRPHRFGIPVHRLYDGRVRQSVGARVDQQDALHAVAYQRHGASALPPRQAGGRHLHAYVLGFVQLDDDVRRRA